MTRIVKVSDTNIQAQRFIIAQIIRNKYAIDYWMDTIGTLMEQKKICRHHIKQQAKNCIEAAHYYEAELRSHFTVTERMDPWEHIQDAAYWYWKELDKMMVLFEQALIRMMQKNHVEDAQWLCKLSAANTLLYLASKINGMEGWVCPDCRYMLEIGARTTDLCSDLRDPRMKVLPSAIGHLHVACERLNTDVLKVAGIKDGKWKTDTEIENSIRITSNRIMNTFMDYDLMWVLMEDDGHTLDEAKQIIAEQKQKMKELELKEQHKEELKKAKKAAKDNQ